MVDPSNAAGLDKGRPTQHTQFQPTQGDQLKCKHIKRPCGTCDSQLTCRDSQHKSKCIYGPLWNTTYATLKSSVQSWTMCQPWCISCLTCIFDVVTWSMKMQDSWQLSKSRRSFKGHQRHLHCSRWEGWLLSSNQLTGSQHCRHIGSTQGRTYEESLTSRSCSSNHEGIPCWPVLVYCMYQTM